MSCDPAYWSRQDDKEGERGTDFHFPLHTGGTLISPDIQALDLRSDLEGGLERLARALTQIALDAQGGFAWDATRPPYPGLLAFQRRMRRSISAATTRSAG
jgi:hypothetical protein